MTQVSGAAAAASRRQRRVHLHVGLFDGAAPVGGIAHEPVGHACPWPRGRRPASRAAGPPAAARPSPCRCTCRPRWRRGARCGRRRSAWPRRALRRRRLRSAALTGGTSRAAPAGACSGCTSSASSDGGRARGRDEPGAEGGHRTHELRRHLVAHDGAAHVLRGPARPPAHDGHLAAGGGEQVHSAGTLRWAAPTGAWPPPGRSTMKSSTPCSSGGRPVAIVVQSIGETSGGVATSVPFGPAALSRASVGRRPPPPGVDDAQSAPSMPTSRTLRAGRRGRPPPDGRAARAAGGQARSDRPAAAADRAAGGERDHAKHGPGT